MILAYPNFSKVKPRALQKLGGVEEAAIFDLIFNKVPLRLIAKKINLSYQGVYIRALAYMLHWSKLGVLTLDQSYFHDHIAAHQEPVNNTEGREDG